MPEDSQSLFPGDLPATARLVIIGGGVVGSSTAYHLAKLGWRDMVLLDQGPLFHNWGSTSHAPGLIFQHNNSQAVCKLAQWTVQTYGEVAPSAPVRAFFQVGSIEIAGTRARAEELKRKLGNARAWGLEAHLVGNDDIQRMVPIMRTDDLHGGFHVPSDVDVKAAVLCEAMARFGIEKGALRVLDNVTVTAVERDGRGRVRAVVTSRGRIETDLVLCAAGIWGPEMMRIAGVNVPLTPMQHLYVRTAPLKALLGESEELRHPIVREQDQDMYYRQHGEAYGFGSYGHEPLPVEIGSVPRRANAAMFPFTPEHMEPAFRAARHRFPALAQTPVAHSFNGIFSFTPDAQSVLGEAPELPGFWVAEAVWVTHGGGVGRVMAEWLANGDPGIDLREADINRFPAHAFSRRFVLERSCQQYREVYDIIHPMDPPSVSRNLRLAPYHSRLAELGGRFFEGAGWERPQWFEANAKLPAEGPTAKREGWAARNWSPIVAAEHLACRERVGLFDITAFAKFEVSGPGAAGLLQRLAANDVDQPVGKVVYTAMLTPRGRIKCDLTVIRLGQDRFWVVTGGRVGTHDLAWIRKHQPSDGSVHITDLSSAYCAVGLWGPRARDVLAAALAENGAPAESSPEVSKPIRHAAGLANERFPYLTARPIEIGAIPAVAVRISYVGELGWEIYAPSEFGLALWDSIWNAGRAYGMVAVGNGAVDSLRLEKGYRLWGADIHTDYNPFEAGLGFAVKMGKGEFLGREALEKAKAAGPPSRRLSCLVLDDPTVALMGKEPVFAGGRTVSYVTSANQGHSAGSSIAYAYLPAELAREGARVEVYSFGNPYPASVAREPLFDPKGERLRA